ncbi:hypothetical protein BD410DRAFT_789791 [Rickenella mellea]|uniref:Uncharacterized protein n=1 Tax=Rickenella mellea TaxID=50990 RepID=A0A4Y7Q2A9_9AGAM|nr:hypothetical protein BD410DRAFT_789791 [Rickenella mellea]
MSSTNSQSTLSFGTRLGLVFIVQAAFLSLVSVLALLTYIAYAALKLRKTSTRKWSTGTHVHYYFLNMLVSEVVQAVGGILNIRWIHYADVHDGVFCNTQGMLKQIGDVGVALSSLAIAVHTFFVLVFRWKPDPTPRTAIFVLLSIWLFIGLSVGINSALNGRRGYWGDTGFWCWITTRYQTQRIVLEYLWLWLTSLLSIVAYVPIALVIKGVVVVEGSKIHFREKGDSKRGLVVPTHARDPNGLALQMLFYPLIYIITVLPIAIVRWRVFVVGANSVPPEATFFADVLFSSSGLFNVLLFSVTRPSLLPRREPSSSNDESMHLPQDTQLEYTPFEIDEQHAPYCSSITDPPQTANIYNKHHGRADPGRLPDDDYDIDAPYRSPITAPPRTADIYDRNHGRADLGRLPDDDTYIDDEWLSLRRFKLTPDGHVEGHHVPLPAAFS